MDEIDREAEIITCPQCDAQQDEAECFLGQLGTRLTPRQPWLTHYRCRYCGWTFSESGLSRDIAAQDDERSKLASYFTPDQGGQA